MKRYTLLLFAASLAVFAASPAGAGTSAQKKEWANFARYESANAKLEKAPEVVFMGNSITARWVSTDTLFWQQHPEFAGRGISGQTTSQMLVRFRRDVLDLKPAKVVILAGINDIAENNGPIKLENVMGNIQSMCELAVANGIEPILCSVLPCAELRWAPEIKPANNVVELNEMIKTYAAAQGFVYIDYYPAMAMPDGSLNPEYTDDGCHPTLVGYKVMEPILLRALK